MNVLLWIGQVRQSITAVFAPVAAFIESFNVIGTPVTAAETRAHMGLTKVEEIRALFNIDRVRNEFQEKYGRPYSRGRYIGRAMQTFSVCCLPLLEDYTTPIPGVVETISGLRAQGIKIGSTTGLYPCDDGCSVVRLPQPADMWFDNCVTPDGLPAGRPAPYMIYKNMTELAVPSVDCVVKVGDTIADIKEGVNAKVWTVGVVLGSNELGLTLDEVNALSATELELRKQDVRNRMLAAGAHYTVDSIEELPAVIDNINNFKLSRI